jgi:hypothetical protein
MADKVIEALINPTVLNQIVSILSEKISITLFPCKNTVNLESVQSASDISPSWNNI